eukprot:TRINITY_DN107033_c0_g1_i1.p1 TRINITY_DN107033_c0_g1~~TRINITY_DN107033_c0_g1_i1.p1  ORF type:complete len:1559 (+),score=429.79 TRINITY_DN107033_c0_g1_i1:111-4679(+)
MALVPHAGATGASSSTAPGATSSFAGASTATTGPKRKQASVKEMLEYVTGLGIDPIKEADFLWIAEEAFNAPLPPSWSEHQDDQNRIYFHNASTGDSTWKHPLDGLFREIVEYQRQVIATEGFWHIEDKIAEEEENIRKDLADWMELFAEDGEKFFYNQHTEESRFDDPRMAVYHELYARIKMVAKMKERFPIFARRPRPEEPSAADKEMQRKREEDQKKYLSSVLRIQTAIRVMIAKRRARAKRAQAVVQKGPQPLRGKMRLRMEKIGPRGGKELRLSQTTPHKRHRAAKKIQARMRGVLARKRFKPLIAHRCFLSKEMTKIQCIARIWLARRRVARKRQEHLHKAANDIQRVFRGHRDRQYVNGLRAEKARFEWILRSVISLQSGVRMALAVREKNRRKLVAFASSTAVIQQQAKVFIARLQFQRSQLVEQPVQGFFVPTTDPKIAAVMPWTWQLWCAPWINNEEQGWKPEAGESFTDAFSEVGVSNFASVATVHTQKLARGYLGRKRARMLWAAGKGFVDQILNSTWQEIDRRVAAAVYIQSRVRGMLIRRKNLIYEKKNAHLKRSLGQIIQAQAYAKRYYAQEWLVQALAQDSNNAAATQIQAAWRAWLARRNVERLREEALWPVKGWFEYTATGSDAVQVEVCFLANPSFDDYSFFLQHGSNAALHMSLQELEEELAVCMTTAGGNELDDALGKIFDDRPPSADGSSRVHSSKPSKDEPASEAQSSKAGRGRLGSSASAAQSVRSAASRPETSTQIETASKSSKEASAKAVPKPKSEPKRSKETVGETDRPSSKTSKTSKANEDADAAEEPKAAAKKAAAKPSSSRGASPEVDSPQVAEEPAAKKTAPKKAAAPKEAAKETPKEAPKAPAAEVSKGKQDAPAAEQAPATSKAPDVQPDAGPTKVSKETKKSPAAKAKAEPEAAQPESTQPAVAEPSAKPEAEEAAAKAKAKVKAKAKAKEKTEEPAPSSAAEPDTPPQVAETADEVEQSRPPSKTSKTSKTSKEGSKEVPAAHESEEHAEVTFSVQEVPETNTSPNASPNKSRPGTRHKEEPTSPSAAHEFLLKAARLLDERPPPRPPATQPRPPSLDPHGSARNMSQSNQANSLRQSSSAKTLDPVQLPPKSKEYAGKVKNGKFERTKIENVEDFTETEKAAILADIEMARQKKMQEIMEKSKGHQKRRQQQDQARSDHVRNMRMEAESLEEERRRKNVKALKKWLKQKEAEDKAKKERENAMLQELMEQETKKADLQKQTELERLEQRERRLKAAEKNKAKLEKQLLASREAALQQKLNPPQQDQMQMPPGPPEMVDPRMQQQQMLIQQQMMQQQQLMHPSAQQMHGQQPGYPQMPPQMQRVVHRHIHHHVHYHEGEEGEGSPGASMEDRRRIENSSEERVRQQLEAQEMQMGQMGMFQSASAGQLRHPGLPPVDHGAETPTMQRGGSMGHLQGQWGGDESTIMRMTRTQEAFRPSPLPQLDAQEAGRRHGVPNFGKSVERAIGSYADSGRPRFVKQGVASSLQR